MKPLNYKEIELIAIELNKNCGVPLQRVGSSIDSIELSFWTGDKNLNWLLSLKANRPFLLPVPRIVLKKNIKKPWINFLTQHFIDSVFQEAVIKHEGERILILKFNNIDLGEQEIEINLFPKGVNFILRSQNKQVSYKKVKEFTSAKHDGREFKVRSFELMYQQYLAAKEKVIKKINYEDLFNKEKSKLIKIKDKLSAELLSKNEKILLYKKLAEDMQTGANDILSSTFSNLIDDGLSPFQNANLLFAKYKKEKSKIENGRLRLLEVEKQIRKFQEVTDYKKWHSSFKKVEQRNTVKVKNKQTKFKTFVLPNNYKLMCGLSSKNNDELRKLSKPWHIWMHLRDYPSTHGIIPVNKGEKLPNSILQQAGAFLVKFNFKDKKQKYSGLKFNLIYSELRYVNSIKGAPGKVTFVKDKNILIEMPSGL